MYNLKQKEDQVYIGLIWAITIIMLIAGLIILIKTVTYMAVPPNWEPPKTLYPQN